MRTEIIERPNINAGGASATRFRDAAVFTGTTGRGLSALLRTVCCAANESCLCVCRESGVDDIRDCVRMKITYRRGGRYLMADAYTWDGAHRGAMKTASVPFGKAVPVFGTAPGSSFRPQLSFGDVRVTRRAIYLR